MKTRLILSLAFITITAFYFIYLSPYMTDNYIFSRYINPGYASFYAGASIKVEPLTFANAFLQARELYFTWCGRFMGNMAVYSMFMLPHWLYCIVAAFMFSLYIVLLQACIFGRQWRRNLSASWVLGLAALVWLGIPSFGDAFLWPSVGGQAALLGQALIFLPFRCALDHPYDFSQQKKWLYGILGLVAGCAVASLDYATSAAMPCTGLLCSGWLFYKRRKTPGILLCITAGLCIGAALTLGAPGNAARLSITSHAAVQKYLAAGWLERIETWLAHLPFALLDLYVPMLLLGWGIFVLYRFYGKCFYRHIPISAFLYFVPACLTVGAYLFTAWPPARGFSTVFAQLLICSCIIYVSARPLAKDSLLRVLAVMRNGMICLCMALLLYESFHFYDLAQIIAVRQNLISSANGACVELPELPKNSGDRYWALGSSQNDISDNPAYYVNRAMAAYYGVRQILPRGKGERSYKPIDNLSGLPHVAYRAGRFIVLGDSDKLANGHPLYLYYYGNGSILRKLPATIGKWIFAWLAKGRPGDYRIMLVPILLTRADLISQSSYESGNVDVYEPERIWLVSPGHPWNSFDLIPYGPD